MNLKELGDRSKWLKEGMDCNVLTWNNKVKLEGHLRHLSKVAQAIWAPMMLAFPIFVGFT